MSDQPNPPASTGEKLSSIKIEDEMRGAYLDYAMSVIIGRALPEVRDGLKPVHRRALYAMYDLGNAYNKPYKKSARVVGDVIGKYHPHGDQAVYDTIVRMAQDFSLRYPLVDGQGNFGSVDGDSPAAMRYTEIRMSKITDELLADLEKETVDFGPNYDESLEEPLVLPTKVPNLLVNGASGIAVGMSTNIPPHNLCEIVEAAKALIDNPSLDSTALLDYVKGPDFPTSGLIVGNTGIKKAYKTGKGVITIRARAEIEEFKKDRERIIVTELPYQVNKARLIEKIADLVKNKKIEGISDLRDESDRKGMRMVIEIKKGENSNVILNRLYKLTQMQDSFGITLLAIHNNQPKLFNLRDMLWAFVEHRRDVILRRTAYDLRKAKERAHLLEGLKLAVENIDAVVELIKKSKGPAQAKAGLMSEYGLSELQAQAILDMRLQRLTGLERDKILADYQAVLKLIEELKTILANEKLVYEIIVTELDEIKEKFGDERRTEIIAEESKDFEVEDLIADEETLVTLSHRGYIKRQELSAFRRQGRGGKGIKGMNTGEEDFVANIYRTTTLSYLLCFTDQGRVYHLKVYKIPEASRASKGKAIVNLLALGPGERIRAVVAVRDFPANQFVLMASRKGYIKKTPLSEFSSFRTKGLAAMSVPQGDELVSAHLTDGTDEVFICTTAGTSIRFPEENVRPMGRSSRGVTAVNLSGEDSVIAVTTLDKDAKESHICMVTEKGYGKRTPLEEYRVQSRGGKGITAMKTTDRNGAVVEAIQVKSGDEIMVVSSSGIIIRTGVDEISIVGRVTQGVRVMNLKGSEKVVAVGRVADSNEEGNA